MKRNRQILIGCAAFAFFSLGAVQAALLPAEKNGNGQWWRVIKRERFTLNISQNGGTAYSIGPSVRIFGPSLTFQGQAGPYFNPGAQATPWEKIAGEEFAIPGGVRLVINAEAMGVRETKTIEVTQDQVKVVCVGESFLPAIKVKSIHYRGSLIDYARKKDKVDEFEAMVGNDRSFKGEFVAGFEKISSLKRFMLRYAGGSADIVFDKVSSVEMESAKGDIPWASITVYPRGMVYPFAPLPGEKFFFSYHIHFAP